MVDDFVMAVVLLAGNFYVWIHFRTIESHDKAAAEGPLNHTPYKSYDTPRQELELNKGFSDAAIYSVGYVSDFKFS